MSEMLNSIMFYIIGFVVIISAFSIVSCRNLVYSAISMTVCFIAIAGLYALLNASFLAVVQLMVYAGTVAVLIVLSIMMTRRVSMTYSNMSQRKHLVCAIFLSSLIAVILSGIFLFLDEPRSSIPANISVDNVLSQLANLLFGKYALSFEIAAVLLLAAMIGAIVLAKGADGNE